MTQQLRTVIVGAGAIGNKRAAAIQRSGIGTIARVVDVDSAKAAHLASRHQAEHGVTWQDAVRQPDVDLVIVSTSNNALAEVTIAALSAGKHVLCEKPLGRSAHEAALMVGAAQSAQRLLKVGFNHRYHPALRKAHSIAAQGLIGDLFSIRCRYGHGGRPGYDLEWRAIPEISGGGELLDQGIHLVDLCCWFMGAFTEATGFTEQYFWRAGGPVEDNAFALMRTPTGQVAQLHASWTQWKNLFSFEVAGRDGLLVVEGLGGSYGPERLSWYRRKAQSGPPDLEIFDFPGEDDSWVDEWRDLGAAITGGSRPLGTGEDGLRAMRLIEAIYESSRTATVVRLPV